MKLTKATLASLVVLAASATSAFAQQPTNLSAVVGTWVNVDPATRGIVKVVVTNVGGQLHIHTYGKCTPTPCDHGDIAANAFSPSVSDAKATGFSGQYDFGFKTTEVTGLRAGALLALETRNKFAGGDSRYDYVGREMFRRKLILLPPVILK